MSTRWKIARGGIFNFWYYDDQEFQFADGRLILRGANGSGKSVTMQSFIPLVLDGDKRPWRLDPFGSRDRRIEYYLLGDADSPIQERTGYLYLEFFHPEEEKFLTIGIGLRARKGNQSVSFWGFVLQDQRRIGHNFFLYDHDYERKYGEKVPLSREKLTEQVGAGGKVVRDQSDYRRLVNQALFGFADDESYQELLDLLIQLRSPKLSKDFKPSTIYGILTNALPPLKEEELRPLSDVLEDMDQISATLDELSIHRKEVERLDEAYSKYNQYLLYEASESVLSARKERDLKREEVERVSQHFHDLQKEISLKEAEKEQAEMRLQEIRAEVEILSRHEAVEKQKELEQAKAIYRDVTEQLQRCRQRMEDGKKRLDRDQAALAEERERQTQELKLQDECLHSMEQIARDAEFTSHDLYHRRFGQLDWNEDGIWQAWRRDVQQHLDRLKEAHSVSLKEKEAKERVEAAERELSEARKERDEKEEKFREAEKRLAQAVKEQEERIYQWYRSLSKLPLSEDSWRGILYRLQDYPQTSYTQVKEPAVLAFQETKDQWYSHILLLQHEQQLLKQKEEELKKELAEWVAQKDPEPPRRQSREESRKKRLEQGFKGLPLYACCDFRDHLSEEEKARVESVLEHTGLLDAWIAPGFTANEQQKDGAGESIFWQEGTEEFIIASAPVDFGYTLAELLQPTPPEDGSITVEEIDRILRTIRLDGEISALLVPENPSVGADNFSAATWINEKGQFQLGALFGQVEIKPQAQYIGKKTRERTRRQRMEALQQEIAQLQEEQQVIQNKIDAIRQDLHNLQLELERFPSENPLSEAENGRKAALFAFEQMQRHLEKIDQEYKNRIRDWRSLQQQLLDLTGHWSRLKTESLLREAIEDIRTYDTQLGELRSSWNLSVSIKKQISRLEKELEETEEQLSDEEEQLLSLSGKKRDLEHRIETYQRLLEELGILDISQQMEALKNELAILERSHKQLQEVIQNHRIESARIEERLKTAESVSADKEQLLQNAMGRWIREWNRRLLPEWKEHPTWENDPENEKPIFQMCLELIRRYRKDYERKTREQLTNSILTVFNEIKNLLLDYVLELLEEDQGQRFLILSMRDRQHPISPAILKEELIALEAEQRNLLNEKDRELYEQIIIHSVGKAIRHKIYRAEQWVNEMNRLMDDRKTSSKLKLQLAWEPRVQRNESELDTDKLVALLKKDPQLLREDEIEQMIEHFRSRIRLAKQEAEERDSLRKWISELLDYRQWFDFVLYYKKGDQNRRILTDSRFNVLSGGEKAMAMYIPLFVATYSRYSDSRPDSPKLISLDEAFAGVDEENIRDLFQLLTDMDFDYIMTSQVLWGCYDTVPSLSIYEIIRPGDVDFVTLIRYHWNGFRRVMVDGEQDERSA